MSAWFLDSELSTFLLGDPPCIDEGPMVQKPDEITKGNKRVKIGTDVYVINGYNVTLDCNIANGTTPIIFSWLLNGTEDSDYDDDDANITINDEKYGPYGGVITCRANNSIGFDEKSTTIHVECKSFYYTTYKCSIS